MDRGEPTSAAGTSATSATPDAGLHIFSKAIRPDIRLSSLFITFLIIGSPPFGGMWEQEQQT